MISPGEPAGHGTTGSRTPRRQGRQDGAAVVEVAAGRSGWDVGRAREQYRDDRLLVFVLFWMAMSAVGDISMIGKFSVGLGNGMTKNEARAQSRDVASP